MKAFKRDGAFHRHPAAKIGVDVRQQVMYNSYDKLKPGVGQGDQIGPQIAVRAQFFYGF
jgi:hypothetical protein